MDDLTNHEQRAKVFAALSDSTRLRLVELLLAHGRLSGSELAEKAGISLALLSHHWKLLNDAGLITRQKIGQTTYCSVNRAVLNDVFAGLLHQPSPT